MLSLEQWFETPQKIDYNRVNMMAREYAKGLNFPIAIDFVEKGQWVAWVVDDVWSWYKQSVKHIYINLPKLQEIVFTQTQKLWNPKLPTGDQIVQIALHEVGHLYENAQLMYRWDKISQSSEIESDFWHTVPVFVQRKFDSYKWNTLIEKRKNLVEWEQKPNYHRFENMIRDIWVNNRSSDLQVWVWALREAMSSNYTDRAFPWDDWTVPDGQWAVMPLFLQFAQWILRNAMTPDNPVKLDLRVERLIARWSDSSYITRQWKPMSIITMASDVSLPFPVRLPYLFFLFEEYKKLHHAEKEENQKNNEWEKSDDQNEWNNQWNNEKNNNDWEWTQNNKSDNDDWNGKEWAESENWKSWQKMEWWESNDQNNSQSEKQWTNKQKWQNNKENWAANRGNEWWDWEVLDSRDIDWRFREWEEKAWWLPHHLEDALGDDAIQAFQEEIKKAIEEQEKENRKPQSRKDAEKRLSETKYRDLAIDDPEEREKKVTLLENRYTKMLPDILSTYSHVIDMIEHEVFEQIKSKRVWMTPINKWPRDMERGNWQLHVDGMVSLLRDWYRGEDITQTEAWQIEAKQEKNDQIVTGFRLRLVLDGSGSMEDDPEEGLYKNRDQAVNTFLIMQACKNIACKLMGDMQIDPTKQLSIITEVMIYSGSVWNKIIKPSSDDFTDENIIEMLENIWLASGGTPMHLSLQDCVDRDNQLDSETKEKIKTGKRADTMIVMSDGQVDNAATTSTLITKLREQWTIVSGIGITKDGSPMKKLFWEQDQGQWCGVVCENTADLWVHMQEALVAALRKCV